MAKAVVTRRTSHKNKLLVFIFVFFVHFREISSSSSHESEQEPPELELPKRPTPSTRTKLKASHPEIEMLNSSESVLNDLDYMFLSSEDDFRDPGIDVVEDNEPSATTTEGELNYWQFRKMPDQEENYRDDIGFERSTKRYGDMMEQSSTPAVKTVTFGSAPAEDRVFISRHSKKIKLPTYTTVYSQNEIIPHGPGRGKHGRKRSRGGGQRKRRRRPPHHHLLNHFHHHQDHHGSMQKYVPTYISYGPILAPPPGLGGHHPQTTIYHGQGHHTSHSHQSPYMVSPPGSAPPLPPFHGTMAGPHTHLGPPMAAIYIPTAPVHSHSQQSSVPNRFPAALPYMDDHPPDNYYIPPSSKGPPRKRPSRWFGSSSRAKPYASRPSPVYVPLEIPSSGHRHNYASTATAPRPLYNTPGNSYKSVPMNFGQPMHNFGPPMSSYGQPPPIIGDPPRNIYAPTDEMYTYNDDSPGTQIPYRNYEETTRFPGNKYGGASHSNYEKEWNPATYQQDEGFGYSSDSAEAYQGDVQSNTVEYRPPSNEIRLPSKPYQPPRYEEKTSAAIGNNEDLYPENVNDYPRTKYRPEASLVSEVPVPRGLQPRKTRPPSNYDTRYNSPGLSKDLKIVDWMPYSTKEYRQLPSRQKGQKSGKKERYSTLPDSLHSHTPDPKHQNYPKLTYDAIKKRVLALHDLQTSSTNSKKQSKSNRD